MKRTAFLLSALAMLLGLVAAVQAADDVGIKHRVIVGSFEDKASHGWYHGPGPGEGMADMLITALVKSGQFRVYERAALDEILAEKNLSLSDLANPGVEAGRKLEIGDILVKGVITEFGYKESKMGGSLSKFTQKAGVGNYSARVAVDLRLISVGDGEVLWAETVAGTENSRSLSVSNSDFSFGSSKAFDDHVVGKATRKVIDQVVDKLGEETAKLPWQGMLIVADEYLFIDGGSELGISPGMTFAVKRLTKEVKHPKTGAILKRIYTDMGTVKATEVEEGVTTVVKVSGGPFQEGDLVTLGK